ncbi:polyketide synthase [Fusarium globosum]|uniref:Polyketide synthase n=1 Tax=Fusarium globosum TaxID=78864 RepID=A0A8H5UJG6_9HYPO|nr:polyketide synthase [Fusarium globosum]
MAQNGKGPDPKLSVSIFKKTIQSLDAHLQTPERAPEWNIEEELQKSIKTSRLNSAELSQPLCTAIQVARVHTFASIGVYPAAVVGHSSGEVAAAYAVGAITANEAIAIAFYRGLVAQLQTKSGAMAAIVMGSKEIQDVTIAGDTEAVKNMTTKVIKESHPDVMARLLQVDMAARSFPRRLPTKLFFSSVQDKLLTEASAFGPRYWQQNMESRVLFSPAVSSIIQHDISKNAVFLEVGPHSALAGPLRQIQANHSTSLTYISALVRHENDVESFLTCIRKLFTVNVEVDLTKVIAKGSILPDLPRYPWNHSER